MLAATSLLGAAACGNDTSEDSGGTRVIGSFYPMAWLAQRVGGDDVKVSTLTQPGVDPHDLELSPKQVGSISNADHVVYIKGVQPAVDQAVEQHAGGRGLDAARAVKTLPPPIGEHHEDEGHDGQDHAGSAVSYDPHLWLDPSRMASVATELADRLGQADGAHRDAFTENARAVTGALTKLDAEFRAGLRTCRQKTMVTSHAAFGYLADRYGLTQVPIAGIDPQDEPSPARLAELTKEIARSGASTIFTETLVSPKVARTLANETGVRTATLDPAEGIARGSSDDYLSIMRRNLSTLRTALSCP